MKLLLVIFVFSLTTGFSQTYITPQALGANFVKPQKVKSEIINQPHLNQLSKTVPATHFSNSGHSTGASFVPLPFEDNLGINQLSRAVTKKHLNRDLFGAPQFTATYYFTEFDANSNVVQNTYVQFVSDSKWNRVLYGSLNGALKSYTNIKNPGKIVINPVGYIFIADRGNSKVQVLKIKGKEGNIALEYLFSIDDLGSVSSITYNDGGTPFNLEDDYLFVADASSNSIYKYDVKDNSAQKVNTYKDLKWPSSITFGRSNGANTNALYVIDNYSKKITLYDVEENELIKKGILTGQPSQTFASIESDYFGQIYIADIVNNEITKYTSDLKFLDAYQSPDQGFTDISIPFGTVKFYGEEKFWSGFDQLITVQNWTENSGIKRYKLITAIKDFSVNISDDDEVITSQFTLTDFSNVKLRVKQNGKTLYEGNSSQFASGDQNINWNRRTNDNQQVSDGDYSLEVEFESLYDNALQTKSSSFYLPLYYNINCGDEDNTQNISMVKGTSADYNGIKVLEGNEYVAYKVSGLIRNPNTRFRSNILKDLVTTVFKACLLMAGKSRTGYLLMRIKSEQSTIQ